MIYEAGQNRPWRAMMERDKFRLNMMVVSEVRGRGPFKFLGQNEVTAYSSQEIEWFFKNYDLEAIKSHQDADYALQILVERVMEKVEPILRSQLPNRP